MPAGELDARPSGLSRRRLDVEHQFRRAGDLAEPGEQPHRHAHARLNASARAVSSSGSAVAPSIHDVAALEVLMLPDRHNLLHALDRVAAGGERLARGAASATTMTTLASPMSSLPSR